MTPVAPYTDMPSEPGFVYHATNQERALDIAREGLRTHKPWEFTDQDTWPDGSTEKRSYFSRRASTVWSFAPEDGEPVILRTPERDWFQQERFTGDIYTTRKVAADALEILTTDGWKPVRVMASYASNPARTIEDLPNGVRIGVVEDFDEDDDKVRSFIVYYADSHGHPLPSSRDNIDDPEPEKYFSGVVRTLYRPACQAYEVIYSIAAPGWGPLLYDTAIELASQYGGGLMSDRKAVSDAACRVWTTYRSRPDVSQRELPPRRACAPGAECSTEVAFTKGPTNLNRLEAERKILYFDDAPPGAVGVMPLSDPEEKTTMARPIPLHMVANV